jgi:hypothetical protein
MAQQEIRAMFLKAFFKQIVINVKLPEKIRIEIKKEEADEKISLINIKPLPRINPPQTIQVMPKRVPINIEKIESLNIVQRRMQQSGPVTKSLTSKEDFQKSVVSNEQAQDNLAKLRPFINDRSVTSIECAGPGKQIMINRSGMIQTPNFTLNDNEISLIMKEISDKTRIPLTSGVFKAAFEGFIITAVISDFVGTRFLLQRRMPGMMQMPQPGIQQQRNSVPIPTNRR